MMMHLNLFAGTLVVVIGLWMVWGTVLPAVMAGSTIAVGAFLWWRSRTITEVWAWSTLFLGLESFAWPLMLMAQLKDTMQQPSDDDMGTILSAVVLGLFSSVFWISFACGLFRRAWNLSPAPASGTLPGPAPSPSSRQEPSPGLTSSQRGPRQQRT